MHCKHWAVHEASHCPSLCLHDGCCTHTHPGDENVKPHLKTLWEISVLLGEENKASRYFSVLTSATEKPAPFSKQEREDSPLHLYRLLTNSKGEIGPTVLQRGDSSDSRWAEKQDMQWKDLSRSGHEGTALLQPAPLPVHTHTHAYTHSSERSKISPTCELMTCCYCTLSHLMRSPSFFFSSASLCRTFISFSYSSSVRKLKSNMFSATFFSSSDRWSNDTPATNPDQLAAMPWAAPSVLSEIRLEQKGFIHNSMAWVEVVLAFGPALPGSRHLFPGTFCCSACLPLPGKYSQQNAAPSLSFRHGRSNLEASVNQTGKHSKERARRLPRQAQKLSAPPAPLACTSFSREVCLRGVQASLQRNNIKMPFW